MLLKDQWVNDEIKEEIIKFLETNDNENTTLVNLRDAAITVPRGTYIARQAFLNKQEKSQINNLTYYVKNLKKKTKLQSQKREGNNKDQRGKK